MDVPYRVVIVDDEMISRSYMELFIKPSRNYEIAASLPFARDALTWCEQHEPPDMIIMDVMMSEGIDGLTAAKRIRDSFPKIRVILVTSMADPDWMDKAREYGIDSFWFKNSSEKSLLEVMDLTMAGEKVYPGQTPDIMLGRMSASELTRKQRSILRYLTEGLSNREIAEKMYLSPNTVKDYLDDLMEKTDLHSRTALASRAARLGIVVSGMQ